jgi:UDP-GlcNAc:undecaprenyl-phosphate/decaprenyl-phosphate GlcNAc-1-phosphate transferase
MLVLFIVGGCSLITSLVLTPIFRDFFAFLEMVDQPDGRRKLHVRPIPRVGGISIAISYIFVLAAVVTISSFWKEILAESGPSLRLLARLLPALVIIFITGLLDDFRGLTPWQKVSGQVVAACWAFWAGVRPGSIIGHPQLDFWMFPLSVLWLVFCANAFNLIDGLDGLASGVALLGAAGLLMAGVIHHHPSLALAIVPLLGALLGFLYYNFSPATVFLGDCGSLLIGFLLGCFGLMWNRHAASGLGPLAPLMAIAVPAADVAISITRRFLRQQPIFNADRNHIHHRLLSLGMTERGAALALYGVSALAVTLAVLQTIVRPHTATMLIVLFAVGAYLGVRKLGYVEFSSVGIFLLGGELRRMLRLRICLKEYEDSLSGARSLEECWAAVSEVCRAAGFRYVALQVEGKLFELTAEVRTAEHAPRMLIPLSASGQITFVKHTRASASAMWIAPIVEALEKELKMERRFQKSLAADEPVERFAALTAVTR